VEKYLELSEYAENWVNQSTELEMVVPRTSFNTCFRFRVAEGKSNDFNLTLRNTLHQDGKSLVGVAYIEGRLVMRFLISNPAAEHADIDNFFSGLVKTGRDLLVQQAMTIDKN
jgi:glutamate/tyrosine decarboxylase-like PLP-dependent enzyme